MLKFHGYFASKACHAVHISGLDYDKSKLLYGRIDWLIILFEC